MTIDQRTELERPTPPLGIRPPAGRRRVRRRRWIVGTAALLAFAAGLLVLRDRDDPTPKDPAGSSGWATKHYGNSDSPGYRSRKIVEIDFLGAPMFVNKKARAHFLRLEKIFQARAPEYAAAVAAGTPDDWSYVNRTVRGEEAKSNHAFGLAIDVNALSNPLGTAGDMPAEVVEQWEIEGGAWGGRWSRPDPMHFETHLTPEEIRRRYRSDGTPRDWYLEELVGG